MQQIKINVRMELKTGYFPEPSLQRDKLTIFPKQEYLHNINHTLFHVKE